MSKQPGPVGLLIDNLCNLNNGAMEQVREYLAGQPLVVRAQFIGRCAALIAAASDIDATGYEADERSAVPHRPGQLPA